MISARPVTPAFCFAPSKTGVAKSRQPSFETNPFQTLPGRLHSAAGLSQSTTSGFPRRSRLASPVRKGRGSERAENCSTRYRPSSARRGSCDNPRAAPRTRASASCPTSAGNTSSRRSFLWGFLDRCSCGQINPAPRARTCHFFITPAPDPSSRSRLSGSRRCWRRSCSFPACRTARPCRGRSCGSRS